MSRDPEITPFDEVVRRYVEERRSIRQIAAAFTEAGKRMGYHDVRQILIVAEVPLRSRGGPRPNRRTNRRKDARPDPAVSHEPDPTTGRT